MIDSNVEPHASGKTSGALYELLELSKAMSSKVDLDSLLNVIVEKASAVVGADRTSIFIYEPDTGRLWTRVAQGLGTAKIELPVGSGIAGTVAKTMMIENIPDAYQDPRFNPEIDRMTGYRTRSILCAPILGSRGRILGVLETINKLSSDRFNAEDESLMAALASHVAVALERTRMTEMYVENERLEQALRLAHDIQMRMLPPIQPVIPDGLPIELSAYIRPAIMVGGDLYDYAWNEEGTSLYFCIGDVAGKGVGSALVMAMAKTLLRTAVAIHPTPADLLNSVNLRLYEETDSAMFVTAFCGYLDLQSGTLQYASAGHNPPFLIGADGAIRGLPAATGVPLGVLRKFRYTGQTIVLGKGDLLYLYTDGMTEATNPSEEFFTVARLEQALADSAKQSTGDVILQTLDAVDLFAKNATQADDITMMCVRYLGRGAGA